METKLMTKHIFSHFDIGIDTESYPKILQMYYTKRPVACISLIFK